MGHSCELMKPRKGASSPTLQELIPVVRRRSLRAADLVTSHQRSSFRQQQLPNSAKSSITNTNMGGETTETAKPKSTYPQLSAKPVGQWIANIYKDRIGAFYGGGQYEHNNLRA